MLDTKSGIHCTPVDHTINENINLDPILPYVFTNIAPPASDVAKIKESLGIWKEELSRLRALKTNQSRRNQFNRPTQHDSLLAKITAYSRCISSVRQVPREIWEQIFILFINDTPSKSARSSPLTLGVVSRLWRDVAINTRCLWSKIRISISGFGIDKDREWGDFVELWLSRARGLPLSVSVVVNRPYGSTDRTVTTVLAALIKFSESWESIHLEIPFDYLSSTLLATVKASELPILQNICILSLRGTLSQRLADWTHSFVQPLPAWSIFKAPALRTLHLVYSVVTPTLHDKWSQITDLRLENCHTAAEHCYKILSACKNLQTCSLDNCDPHSLTSVVNAAVQFKLVQLEYLTSFVLYEKTFLPILFDVPNLRSFEFQGFFVRDQPSLLPHLLRSARNLQSLRIDPGSVDLNELLVLTPSIKSLTLAKPAPKYPVLYDILPHGAHRGVTNDVIRRLTPNSTALLPNSGYLCPALESLVCNEGILRTFTNDVLLVFMKKRQQEIRIAGGNIAELKEVIVYAGLTTTAGDAVRPATYPLLPAKRVIFRGELLKLVKGGMKIHLPDYDLKLD